MSRLVMSVKQFTGNKQFTPMRQYLREGILLQQGRENCNIAMQICNKHLDPPPQMKATEHPYYWL